VKIRNLLVVLLFITVTDTYAISERARIELSMQRQAPVDNNGNIVPNNAEHEEEFRQFWKNFRLAILGSNWSKLDPLVKHPLKTRGDSDYDPVLEVTRDEFKRVFTLFLESEQNLITDLEKANPYITESWVRIGDMEFTRESGTWYLSFIFLDLDKIES
jgi:hypothetical protein